MLPIHPLPILPPPPIRKVLEGLGRSWPVLEVLGRSWDVLECSGRFGKVLGGSGSSGKVLGGSGRLWRLGRFWKVLDVLGKFWQILKGLGRFWGVLECSGRFGKVLEGSILHILLWARHPTTLCAPSCPDKQKATARDSPEVGSTCEPAHSDWITPRVFSRGNRGCPH